MADFSTYEGRQAYRDANPGAIVDASGAYYPSTGQTVSGSSGNTSSGGTVGTSAAGSAQLQAGIQGLLGAAASGNKDAINEQIREFNQTFGLDQSKFNDDVRRFNENLAISQSGLTGTYQGQQTEAARLQAANIAAQQAGLTGYYQPTGQETLAAILQRANITAQQAQTAQQWAAQYGYVPQFDAAGNPIAMGAGGPASTLAAQQQTYAQQLGLINQAATLQANPFRQQQAIGQMGRLLGGGGVAGFSAPNTVAGVGVAGGNTQGGMGYLQQMIDDIRDPSANQASMNQVMQGIPTPNKLNSNEFLRAAPSTQNMVLQGMQEKYGIDPADALNQIKATLPQFQAPTTMGTVKR